MTKTISFRFKNTPEDQAFAEALLEGERNKLKKEKDNALQKMQQATD